MAEKLVVPAWLMAQDTASPRPAGHGVFLEKTLLRLRGLGRWFFIDESGTARSRGGFLASIDAAACLGGGLLLLAGLSLTRRYEGLVLAFAFISFIVAAGGLSIPLLFKRCLPLFVFTLILTVPVFFQFSFGGAGSGVFGFIHINLTAESLGRGGFFLSRSMLMLTLVMVLGLVTTPMALLGGLRKFPLPSIFTTMLFISLAGIFKLIALLDEAVSARKARTISRCGIREMEGWFAGTAGYLFHRAMRTSDEVAMAMASRGFDGTLRVMKPRSLRGRDFLCIGVSAFVSFLIIFL